MAENHNEADFFEEINASLNARLDKELEENVNPQAYSFAGQQLSGELSKEVKDFSGGIGTTPQADEKRAVKKKRGRRPWLTVLKVLGIFVAVLALFVCFIVFTTPGRRLGTKWAAKFIYSSMNKEGNTVNSEGIVEQSEVFKDTSSHTRKNYVTNFLIFGIEEFYGASNTDSMILVSLNTKDKTIKLTSFLRDTYVSIPGYKRNKLNSAYARGGADLLVQTLEDTYDIEIEGYASVNFEAFEKIVDAIGGVNIKLGKEEVKYLRHTNYISEKVNRKTIKKGWNHMNGNQAMGYCRVRKVPTYDGVNNDYGRTLRQRRTIKAMVRAFKKKNPVSMLKIAKNCLGYVTTNITEEQIAKALFDVVDNKMFSVKSMRLPADNLFKDSGKAGIGGITYALVIDDYRDKNIDLFHKFIFHKGKKKK